MSFETHLLDAAREYGRAQDAALVTLTQQLLDASHENMRLRGRLREFERLANRDHNGACEDGIGGKMPMPMQDTPMGGGMPAGGYTDNEAHQRNEAQQQRN